MRLHQSAIAALASLLISAHLHATQPRAQFVGLTVGLNAVELAYPTSVDHAGHQMFFENVPVRVRVTLANKTRQVVQVLEPGGPWSESDLEVNVGSSTGRSVRTRVIGSVLSRAARQPSMAVLQPDGHEEIVLDVRTREDGPLPPGDYFLSARLRPQTFRARSVSGGPVSVDSVTGLPFRVAAIQSDGDRMNYLLQMALLARLGGDAAGAERWLQELLQLNPESIPAQMQLGELARHARDCTRANAHWSAAIGLLRSGRDEACVLQRDPGRREFNIRALDALISECR